MTRIGSRAVFTIRSAGSLIANRPARAMLTSVGILAGTATLVAVGTLVETLTAQVGDRFDARAATTVRVEFVAGDTMPSDEAASLVEAAPKNVMALRGVVAAASIGEASISGTVPVGRSRTSQGESAAPAVLSATGGLIRAVGGSLAWGREFDAASESYKLPIALIGARLAKQLDLDAAPDVPATIFVADQPFMVAGVIADGGSRRDLVDSVVIPSAAATERWGPSALQVMTVRTRPGAASVVAQGLAAAIAPRSPQAIRVIAPPDPSTLRREVSDDLRLLSTGLGAVVLVLGALSIANATSVAVVERTAEIGLRRALGATPTAIVLQFVLEALPRLDRARRKPGPGPGPALARLEDLVASPQVLQRIGNEGDGELDSPRLLGTRIAAPTRCSAWVVELCAQVGHAAIRRLGVSDHGRLLRPPVLGDPTHPVGVVGPLRRGAAPPSADPLNGAVHLQDLQQKGEPAATDVHLGLDLRDRDRLAARCEELHDTLRGLPIGERRADEVVLDATVFAAAQQHAVRLGECPPGAADLLVVGDRRPG